MLLGDPAETIDRPRVAAYYTAAHTEHARDYMTAAETVIPPLEEWFGTPRRKVVLVEFTDPNALPYDCGAYYFVPMRSLPPAAVEVATGAPSGPCHAGFAAAVDSRGAGRLCAGVDSRTAGGTPCRPCLPRPVQLSAGGRRDGVAWFASYRRHPGRSRPFAATASAIGSGLNRRGAYHTADDVFFRSKAAYVWWMLRDMVGDSALQSALARYHPAEDRDTAYLQRLIEKQEGGKRDLEAFFDDWVYRDRGLPQLRVVSAYVRHTLGEQTVTAVTIENLGGAWCEVPVAVRSAIGENTVRLVVPGKSTATIRVPFEATPAKPR